MAELAGTRVLAAAVSAARQGAARSGGRFRREARLRRLGEFAAEEPKSLLVVTALGWRTEGDDWVWLPAVARRLVGGALRYYRLLPLFLGPRRWHFDAD